MTLVNEIRKTVTDTTPVYAAVGATDLAVERLRDARNKAAAVRVSAIQDKARETYSDLADRGEKLVKRIRNQKSTKDLLAQAGNTVSLGKGAVTTVRKAAQDTQRAAKSTLATGRREAGSAATSLKDDVRSAGRRVNKAADTTRSSAEGTVTEVKKGSASAERAAKSVATSARKTAATATKAAKTATPKVGD